MTIEKTSTIYPTNKHNRPQPPTRIPLGGFDRKLLPIQIQNHRFFRRPSIPFTDVVHQLKASLAEALELYPPVAGSVQYNERGEVYIALDKEGIVGTPFLVDLKDTAYTEDGEDLSPRLEAILPPGSSTLAVKVTQFSCGTICVASSFHHQVADLRGFLDFLELWAQVNRNEPIDFNNIPDDWTRNPGRFFSEIIKELEGQPIPVPAPFELRDPPSFLPAPSLMAPSVVTNWKLSKASMEQMKREFSPSPAADSTWISSGDALTALISGAVTRAREGGLVARLEGRSSVESEVESIVMAADGRFRAPKGDMAGGHYLGNFNNLWSLAVSRADLLTPTSEAAGRIALAIRSALDVQLTPESIAKRILFLEDPSRNAHPGQFGWTSDIILTNWCRFDLKGPKLDFGWDKCPPFAGTSGGLTAFSPAFSLIYEDKATGDVFVLLTVEHEGEAGLVSDPLMTKYATLI
ncbi:MAG: transferase [Linnemannia gamsii]|nr:MAG: transferase [Linnemannia gamsii]